MGQPASHVSAVWLSVAGCGFLAFGVLVGMVVVGSWLAYRYCCAWSLLSLGIAAVGNTCCSCAPVIEPCMVAQQFARIWCSPIMYGLQ
eukprot:5626868-Alexandrium_andersonii.AAC.1